MMKNIECVVLGGGAAGFFAALAAAASLPPESVVLLERTGQVLSKVKISGGGRCNVTHGCFEPLQLVRFYPRGHKELLGPFTRFQPRDTIRWFESRGVSLKQEADGRCFPQSDQSQSIIDCLLQEAEKVGVEVRKGQKVESIQKEGAIFTLSLNGGETLSCRKLLLATGSHPQGHAFARHFGHHIIEPVPSLFTFQIPQFELKEFAGCVAHAKIQIADSSFEEVGAVLITHWGFSGPATLKLSAWAAPLLYERSYRTKIVMNWSPESPPLEKLYHAKQVFAEHSIGRQNPFQFPRQLWKFFLCKAGCDPATPYRNISHKMLQSISILLQEDSYQMEGKITHKEEFVTCGGVDLKEIHFKTMESKRCPGLYFAGEILNCDGVTGGFNFQNAWTTGWLAGQGIALN